MDFSNVSVIISIIAAAIAFISTATTIYFNVRNQRQYNKSLELALSFRLVEYCDCLYLQITNTGKSAARNVKIEVNSLENNGDRNELDLDGIFNNHFELFAGEMTQGKIA